MEDITLKEVKRLAKLSALEFSDEAAEGFVKDLNDMLSLISKMNEFEGDDEMFIISHDLSALRDDEVVASRDRKIMLQNAPEKNEEYFIVPKVVE